MDNLFLDNYNDYHVYRYTIDLRDRAARAALAASEAKRPCPKCGSMIERPVVRNRNGEGLGSLRFSRCHILDVVECCPHCGAELDDNPAAAA